MRQPQAGTYESAVMESVLRLVTEPTRHRLLRALLEGERTVGELVGQLQGEQSNLSHHLATLRDAGLVQVRRSGRHQVYRIADGEVARLLREVDALEGRLEQLLYSLRLGIPAGGQFHGYG